MDGSLISNSELLPTLLPNSFSNEQLIEQIGVLADQALLKGNVDTLMTLRNWPIVWTHRV